MVRPQVVVAVVLLVILVTGCDTHFGPAEPRPIKRVVLESVVTADIMPSNNESPNRFSFVPTVSASHGVFFEILEGSGFLYLQDSITELRSEMVPLSRGDSLEARSTIPILLASGRTYLVVIEGLPRGSPVSLRFKVHRIDPAPEHQLNSSFVIGDTISSESIDDILDVDDFRIEGTAGQEIVAGLEAAGRTGTDGITLTVYDPEEALLAVVSAAVGQAGTLTERWTFPVTGTYRFRVQYVFGTHGRYTGPYRFWTYLINRGPEHESRAVTVGTPVTGEAIDPAGDVDEFTFDATGDTQYRVYVQSTRAAPIRLQVLDASTNELGWVETVPADTGLFDHGTAPFRPPSPGPVTLRVLGVSDHSVMDTGSYRLYVRQVNALP